MSEEKTQFIVPMAVRQASAKGTAVLVFIHPPGIYLGRRFELKGPEVIVGRLEENEIAIEAESLSRRHARLVPTKDGWAVEDLGSTNGTFVNDERVEQCSLRDGDVIRFGGAIMKFLSGANLEVAFHEEIYKMTVLDGLTGVHNKRFFLDFLEREIAAALRHKGSLSMVMFDIDHFKNVNDTYGHLTGDAVLKEIGNRLKARMRREDLLARYGGEEFACVLDQTTRAGALAFAESVRVIIERDPFTYERVSVPVTVSLGVATLGVDGTGPVTATELIAKADENLYAAKHAGRNRVVG